MSPIIRQNSHSVETKNVLNQFLANDLVNIIDSYLAHADAMEVLVLGPDGKPVDSELNRTTIAAIKLALTTASCDREIIQQIFKNAGDNSYTGILNDVMNELRSAQMPIILDNVDFSGIDLSGMVFDKASLRNGNFTGVNLDNVHFLGSDLSNAQGLSSWTGTIWINSRTVLSDDTLVYPHIREMISHFGDRAIRLGSQ